MAKTLTHEQWIEKLEELCYKELLDKPRSACREGEPAFEKWLAKKPVEELLAYIKRFEA